MLTVTPDDLLDQEVDTIRELRHAIVFAHAAGFVVTVSQRPLTPLAMGNYEPVLEVRRQRESK